MQIYNNAYCLKCEKVEREMVRVGAIVFCDECASEEFKTENPVTQERENYLKWLGKYYEES